MIRSYRFPLRPTKAQSRDLGTMLSAHRFLWNRCLSMRQLAWDFKCSVTYSEQSSWFKTERGTNNWFRAMEFTSAQATMRRLDRSFKAFFAGCKGTGPKRGHPKFKRPDELDSVEFPKVGSGIQLSKDLRRAKIRWVGRVRLHAYRDIKGEVRTLRIKREGTKWFLIVCCDVGEPVGEPSLNPAVGIDVGLESFATLSNGEQVPNPRFLKAALPALRRASRTLERRTKRDKDRRVFGRQSRRRDRAKAALRRIHGKVRNQRSDFVHKVSRDLVRRFGTIAVERLQISNMLGSHRLARSISDAAWRRCLEATRYKSEESLVAFAEVDPRGTSQLCSGCGLKVPKGLSVRLHQCPHCGLVLHRDVNAARNILSRALARTAPAGPNREVLDSGAPGSPRL